MKPANEVSGMSADEEEEERRLIARLKLEQQQQQQQQQLSQIQQRKVAQTNQQAVCANDRQQVDQQEVGLPATAPPPPQVPIRRSSRPTNTTGDFSLRQRRNLTGSWQPPRPRHARPSQAPPLPPLPPPPLLEPSTGPPGHLARPQQARPPPPPPPPRVRGSSGQRAPKNIWSPSSSSILSSPSSSSASSQTSCSSSSSTSPAPPAPLAQSVEPRRPTQKSLIDSDETSATKSGAETIVERTSEANLIDPRQSKQAEPGEDAADQQRAAIMIDGDATSRAQLDETNEAGTTINNEQEAALASIIKTNDANDDDDDKLPVQTAPPTLAPGKADERQAMGVTGRKGLRSFSIAGGVGNKSTGRLAANKKMSLAAAGDHDNQTAGGYWTLPGNLIATSRGTETVDGAEWNTSTRRRHSQHQQQQQHKHQTKFSESEPQFGHFISSSSTGPTLSSTPSTFPTRSADLGEQRQQINTTSNLVRLNANNVGVELATSSMVAAARPTEQTYSSQQQQQINNMNKMQQDSQDIQQQQHQQTVVNTKEEWFRSMYKQMHRPTAERSILDAVNSQPSDTSLIRIKLKSPKTGEFSLEDNYKQHPDKATKLTSQTDHRFSPSYFSEEDFERRSQSPTFRPGKIGDYLPGQSSISQHERNLVTITPVICPCLFTF